MKTDRDLDIHMIPIEQITVVNSRSRGKVKFKQIVSSISHIGLKKPITVTSRGSRNGQVRYNLVCGQGRLEAYVALGQREVPALVVNVSKEDLMLMSLAENLARRQRTSIEMAREVLAMKERGYKPKEIARKVDLDPTYVTGIIRLLKRGEERLLMAVERRQIPLSMAIAISESTDQEIQRAMLDAYEKGELRGKALLIARRLLDSRRSKGKSLRRGIRKGRKITAKSLLDVYRKESSRQQLLVGRARTCEMRLRFIVSALKKMLANEGLVNLLRAESLASLPQCLADEINGQEDSHDT